MIALYDDRRPTPTTTVDDADLVQLYRLPDGPWVRSNFVATLDGSAIGPDGVTASINTPPDNRIFSLLRALADVVVVGAGTVRAESYGPVEQSPHWQALGLRDEPAPLVVVSASGRLPESVLQRHRTGGRVMMLTREQADASCVRTVRRVWGEDAVLTYGERTVDLAAGLAHLRREGLNHVLAEGGPTLHAALWRDGLIEELCLTLVPSLVGGSGMRILDGDPVQQPLTLASMVLADDGTLLTRYRRP